MKYIAITLLSVVLISSCVKLDQETGSLEDHLEDNYTRSREILIACAAGDPNGFMGDSEIQTAVFFYPIAGATDYRYFETDNLEDSADFTKYIEKTGYTDQPVFNGYLHRFNLPEFEGEKMVILTYKRQGNLHVCDPVRIKTNEKPSEINASLVTHTPNGTTPNFTWTDGVINENVIYFQVISDTLGNLITGTYTYDKTFTFGDYSNVVLNIKEEDPAPQLLPATTYNFTLMAVSEDNWVNLIAEMPFTTQ